MSSARASGSITSLAGCSPAGPSAGTLADLSVTGLTSNPTIFDQAISRTGFYDEAFAARAAKARRARPSSSSSLSRILARPPTCSARRTTSPGATDGWVFAGGLPPAGLRQAQYDRGAKAPPRPGCPPNCSSKSRAPSRDCRRSRSPLRRCADQRHPAFSREHISRRRMRTCAASSAPGRRPRSAGASVASLFVSRWTSPSRARYPTI